MANQIMTAATETSAIVPEVWSARWREVNRVTLPFLDSVDRSYEGEIRDIGDLVNISYFPDFDEADLLVEGAAGESEAVTVTGQQLLINQRAYKDFIVTKKSQLQSLPFMDKARDAAIFAIMKKMQALIISTIVPSASTPDHQIAYDSGSTMQLADIQEAKELLLAANCPQSNLIVVLGSGQLVDLFSITGFVSKDFVPAGSPLSTGEFTSPILGFMPRFTTVVSNTSYFFHPSFLTLAIQQDLNIEEVSMGAEGIRGTRVNCDVLFGQLQLDDERVVSIS